jgi:GT2 family glycosyltransferase
MIKVAALITCFNRRDTTQRCLGLLRNQSIGDDVTIDVFLVDDGSTDGTAQAVAESFPDVRILQGGGTLFWTGGMLLAEESALATEPTHLLWLNDDVCLTPTAVAGLLRASESAAEDAIAVGAVCSPEGGGFTYGGYTAPDSAWPLRLEPLIPCGSEQEVDTANGNVVLIPIAARQRIGPLDERLRHNMADMDYLFRARQCGVAVVSTAGYVGTCERNVAKQKWSLPSTPFRERLRGVVSVKALPPRQWSRFARSHGGRRWPLTFVSPYLRAVFPRVNAERR